MVATASSETIFGSPPLPLGVPGHEGSTVIVVLNGLIALLAWPELKRRRTEQISA